MPWGLRISATSLSSRAPFALPLFIVIISLPILFSSNLWLAVLSGGSSRAWDGTGHYAIAQLYQQATFPDTFGWTNAYFGGMPFPNFYPPAFYWLVAALRYIGVSLETAFKLMLVLPVLLLPQAMWLLGWNLSRKDGLVASATALGVVFLLVDVRLTGNLLAGLDYFSTFQIGLYTQPLGFVLLLAWYLVYSSERQSRWKLALSALLLAFTVLANFFNAVTASVFIAATLVLDLVTARKGLFPGGPQPSVKMPPQLPGANRVLIAHVVSPIVALSLTAFWSIPMLAEYPYFVTRPHAPEIGTLISPALWIWFLLALAGSLLWLRRPTGVTFSYLGACLILSLAVVLGTLITPRWFPLQSARFMSTLTFMLAVPVGYGLVAAFRWFASILGELPASDRNPTLKKLRYTSGVATVMFVILVLTAPHLSWAYAFYAKGEKSAIEDLLEFARQHRDGRYLVEVINPKIGPAWTEASFDARAINSYLGSQGNETISGVFHEASPNSLFTLPVVNAFSNYPDSFGVSSILADDLDFAAQPLTDHIKRAQFLGVKYLTIRTPAMKERINKELPAAIRHDLGWWTVFELPNSPAPKVQVLANKPALVLTSFTVKARRRNELSFIRLAEEQFADNWFDVLLVRSRESKIDRLPDLDNFGALIVDHYDWSDENAAFERLREFAKNRPLICFSADNALFRRLQNSRADFGLLEIIERQSQPLGEMVEALRPTYRYNSSTIRQQWKAIRNFLEQHKTSTNAGPGDVQGDYLQNTIRINPNSLTDSAKVPVLTATTFHPNWMREDGAPIFAVTPFYMLTFLHKPEIISYRRTFTDKLGLWISGITLVGLCIAIVSKRNYHDCDASFTLTRGEE